MNRVPDKTSELYVTSVNGNMLDRYTEDSCDGFFDLPPSYSFGM